MTESASSSVLPGEITARPSASFRVKNALVALMLIGMGVWFAYDGFINWPSQNQQAIAKDPGNKLPHTDLDILIQKILACVLPPAGIALLISIFYRSRGSYQLTPDNILHVPGHDPIRLDNIRRLDKKLWDRKGIVYIDYEEPTTQTERTFKFDDFVYDRECTDAIFKRIETYLFPPETAPASTDSAESPRG